MLVYAENSVYVGLLCSRISRVLGLVAQRYPLDCETIIRPDVKVKNPTRSNHPITITLYGNLADSEAVGILLSDHDVFLQRPTIYDENYKYNNPQFFDIPEFEAMKLSPGSKSEPNLKLCQIGDSLTDLLPSTTDWQGECPVSDLLKTPLLNHQKNALAFMCAREKPSYTVASKPTSNSHCGGILADAMGLGKSLTALALIAGSLSGQESAKDMDHGRTTLLVVPTSTLSVWQEQIKNHLFPNNLRVLVYHGQRRKNDFTQSEEFHLIITTYSTLVSEWSSKSSLLHQRVWYRVILDEAHFIKDRSTKRFRAVCALETTRRWCLSGTPVQNCIDDLSALILFTRSSPLKDHDGFKNAISVPLKKGDSYGLRSLGNILRPMMLRRSKSVLSLPPREDFIAEVVLSPQEMEVYKIVRDKSEILIERYLSSNDFRRGLRLIQSILRQRQICNHGLELLAPGVKALLLRHSRCLEVSNHQLTEEIPLFCEACNAEISSDTVQRSFEACFHLICAKCLSSSSASNETAGACPVCVEIDGGTRRHKVVPQSLQTWENELEYSGPSTKVSALIKNIQASNDSDESLHPPKRYVLLASIHVLYLVMFQHCLFRLGEDVTSCWLSSYRGWYRIRSL